MLGHRLRRWPSMRPAPGQCLVFIGTAVATRGLGPQTTHSLNQVARLIRQHAASSDTLVPGRAIDLLSKRLNLGNISF